MKHSECRMGMPVQILPDLVPWTATQVADHFPNKIGVISNILSEGPDPRRCTIGVNPLEKSLDEARRYFTPEDLNFINLTEWVIPLGEKKPFRRLTMKPGMVIPVDSSHKVGTAMDVQLKEDAGTKYDKGKPRMDLIPTSALKALGEVLEFGAQKYADRNWEKGISWSRLYASTLRHLVAYWDGLDKDEESGLHPLKHALTNIAFLIEYTKTHPELDDRPYTLTESEKWDKKLLSPITKKLLKETKERENAKA